MPEALGCTDKGGDGLVTGGAGGGMERSTGEGESVSVTVLFLRPREERRRGVDVADLTFRGAFIEAVMVGVVRFLDTRALSSSPGDAVRLLGGLVWEGWC
jgi:hypothetical protein